MGRYSDAVALLKDAEAVLRMNRLFTVADRIRQFAKDEPDKPVCPECGEPVSAHTMDDGLLGGDRRIYCP